MQSIRVALFFNIIEDIKMIEIQVEKTDLLTFIASLKGVEYTHIAFNCNDDDTGEEWTDIIAYNDTVKVKVETVHEFNPCESPVLGIG